jgi:hypothetical protein
MGVNQNHRLAMKNGAGLNQNEVFFRLFSEMWHENFFQNGVVLG